MKISLQKAIAGVLFAGAAVIGTAAQAGPIQASTGNGDLTLYVYDNTTGAAYARGMGISIDDLFTATQLQNDTYTGALGSPEVHPTAVNLNFSADANLTAFLSTGHTYQWTIVGGDTSDEYANLDPPGLYTGNVTGSLRYAFTSTATSVDSHVTNDALSGQLTQLAANEGGRNFATGSGRTDSISSGGIYDPNALDANMGVFLYQSGQNINSVVPQAGGSTVAYLYYVTGTGSVADAEQFIQDPGYNYARAYSLATLNMDSQGNITMAGGTPAVPVPAAVWLLGSGLVGLLGVGRRRRSAANA